MKSSVVTHVHEPDRRDSDKQCRTAKPKQLIIFELHTKTLTYAYADDI